VSLLRQVGEAAGKEEEEEFGVRWEEAFKKEKPAPGVDPEEVKAWLAAEAAKTEASFAAKLDAATARLAKPKAKAEKVKAALEAGDSTSLLDCPLDFPKELIGAVAAPAPKAQPEPKAETWPEAPLPPAGATELERLTYPRGLLGHVVQYIVDTDRLPDRQMALAGAMVACHKALDRKILGPGEISVILFLALLAETGAGKNHILNCIRILLRAMGVENAIAGTGIASKQSIDEILEGPLGKPQLGLPSALITIDEYGSFLTRISSKGMGGNITEIPAKLQTLWGWHPQVEYLGDIKVGKAEERVPVYGPAFSIFGVSTDRSFFRAVKEKQVSGGFVNRHFVINAGRGQPIARAPPRPPPSRSGGSLSPPTFPKSVLPSRTRTARCQWSKTGKSGPALMRLPCGRQRFTLSFVGGTPLNLMTWNGVSPSLAP
jgi:hypothetical protein